MCDPTVYLFSCRSSTMSPRSRRGFSQNISELSMSPVQAGSPSYACCFMLAIHRSDGTMVRVHPENSLWWITIVTIESWPSWKRGWSPVMGWKKALHWDAHPWTKKHVTVLPWIPKLPEEIVLPERRQWFDGTWHLEGYFWPTWEVCGFHSCFKENNNKKNGFCFSLKPC